jgi:DNA polymerase V
MACFMNITLAYNAARRFRLYGIVCFLSNYALYADLLNRIMVILEAEAPRLEITTKQLAL